MVIFTKEVGLKICNMEKENNFTHKMVINFKVNLCMVVNLGWEFIAFMMAEFMKDIFIMGTVMDKVN